eukprot:2680865-Rhodomonas_salina.2
MQSKEAACRLPCANTPPHPRLSLQFPRQEASTRHEHAEALKRSTATRPPTAMPLMSRRVEADAPEGALSVLELCCRMTTAPRAKQRRLGSTG